MVNIICLHRVLTTGSFPPPLPSQITAPYASYSFPQKSIYTSDLYSRYRTHSYLGACAYTTTVRKYVLISKSELIFRCAYIKRAISVADSIGALFGIQVVKIWNSHFNWKVSSGAYIVAKSPGFLS